MWINLSPQQRIALKEYCDQKFGITNVFTEHGEPVYLDETALIIDLNLIIELLFFSQNKN